MDTSHAMPPCWIDDEPARALNRYLSGAGIGAWATGSAVRDALIPGREHPRVAEIMAAAGRTEILAALSDAPFASETVGRGLDLRATDEDWDGLRLRLIPLGRDMADDRMDADAMSRDFTMNAVRCDLSGHVVDPLGGLADISDARVRLAAPSGMRDDPVRVLRYARMRTLVDEGDPDPEAMSEARAYAPRLASAPDADVLREMTRILMLPREAMLRTLRDLDGIGALEAIALDPDVGRLGRFLASLEAGGMVRADPYLALGALTLFRGRHGGVANGLGPRWGDGRDRRVEAVAALWNEGPPAPGTGIESVARYGLPSGEARMVAMTAEASLARAA